MTRATHIRPTFTSGCPQQSGYIHHSQILLKSLIGVPCSVFKKLHHSLIGVPCSVFFTPYTFSAKERDLETGYSYFGARYYDAGLSVWLSVDPLSDKYPSMSAYMYCAGNPLVNVDPDGKYFFGLFGSTRAQRQAARQYASRTNGNVHNRHSSNIWVSYHTNLPGQVSTTNTKLPVAILHIVTFDRFGNASDSGIPPEQVDQPSPSIPVFPIQNRSNSFLSGFAAFGSNRDQGRRKHAGSDIYAPVGTEVFSMLDGTVINGPYDFYRGSQAIEVNHGDFIARYCELNFINSVKNGSELKRGQLIGHVSDLQLNNSMLHLELYSGEKTGPLTQRSNMPYQRRSDLIDPTNFLKSIINE